MHVHMYVYRHIVEPAKPLLGRLPKRFQDSDCVAPANSMMTVQIILTTLHGFSVHVPLVEVVWPRVDITDTFR